MKLNDIVSVDRYSQKLVYTTLAKTPSNHILNQQIILTPDHHIFFILFVSQGEKQDVQKGDMAITF